MPPTVQVIDQATWHTATEQIDYSMTLLRQVADRPDGAPLLRIYRPRPTVAFSRRESLMVGFSDAVATAEEHEFSPIIRPTGGRAVAYDSGSLVVDLVTDDGPVRKDNDHHFQHVGELFVDVLRELGLDARLGPVPGEYCPGKYSINARGEVKIVGTSQRVSRRARLLSASIPVEDPSRARQALISCNQALAFDWNPDTFVSLGDEVPGLDIGDVERHLKERFANAAHIV
jgi:octanoyl-[GcvH]:protein N-octanoyltransferase